MNYNIIRNVERWANENRHRLNSQGIEVDERIPAPGDEVPWKASIGFVYEHQIVTLTVWQRHLNEADVIALDTATGKDFPIESLTSEQIDDISRTLDQIVEKLLAKGYRDP